MSIKFSPYISFPGNAGEAMAYYHQIFGGQLDVETYDGLTADAAEKFPFTPPAGAVAHTQLHADGVSLAGGDGIGEDLPPLKSRVYSFLLTLDTVEKAEELIEKFISTGGEVAMLFEPAPWGSYYGQVADKFGVQWAFHVEIEPS